MVIAILPMIVLAVGAGLVTVFSIQGSVTNRLSGSEDAQIVSATYVSDVQSAVEITTDASAAQCGPGTQLLGLESNPNSAGDYQTVVTYARVQAGTKYLLRRQFCNAGPATTVTAATTVSYDISSTQLPPVLSPATQVPLAASGWISDASVTNVAFTLTEPASKYTYSLSAVPADSAAPSTAGSPIVSNSNTTCGFAATEGGTVNNGTYAQTLCFVDFSAYNATQAAAPDCQEMVASIPGGFTLSFCFSESGNQPMVATALPTYPEAFLGNTLTNADGETEPFYTGLGCSDATPPETGTGAATPSCIKPAMYQTDTGYGPSNTLTFTNIAVTTSTGAPATGWSS